jgi:hypothetical protein
VTRSCIRPGHIHAELISAAQEIDEHTVLAGLQLDYHDLHDLHDLPLGGDRNPPGAVATGAVEDRSDNHQ